MTLSGVRWGGYHSPPALVHNRAARAPSPGALRRGSSFPPPSLESGGEVGSGSPASPLSRQIHTPRFTPIQLTGGPCGAGFTPTRRKCRVIIHRFFGTFGCIQEVPSAEKWDRTRVRFGDLGAPTLGRGTGHPPEVGGWPVRPVVGSVIGGPSPRRSGWPRRPAERGSRRRGFGDPRR